MRTSTMTPSTPTRMTRTITTRTICTSEHSSAPLVVFPVLMLSHDPLGSSRSCVRHLHAMLHMCVSLWPRLPPFLLQPVLPRLLPLHRDLHVDLDNLDSVENSLRHSAKGSFDTYDVTFSLTDTEYVNERAVTTTNLVYRQHIKLMSVYCPHSKFADHHIEKMYKTIEKHMVHNNKYIPIIEGDFNAELGSGWKAGWC